jgi:diketogulonate reductase-like aldo/keto reductase
MVNGIADCWQQGLVQEVGVSNYGPKQLRKVCTAAPRHLSNLLQTSSAVDTIDT